MKKIDINGVTYEIINDDSKCINKEELSEKITDYFEPFDYIFGDFSYDKVRLKGYYDSNNKKVKDRNNIKNLDSYIKDYCNYGAKTFLLKKVK